MSRALALIDRIERQIVAHRRRATETPEMVAAPQEVVPEDVLRDREECRDSLATFCKRAWHILEPTQPLKWGWALDAICQHLEAVTAGDIRRLIITVPPGLMKSLSTCVFWPAWEWGPQGRPNLKHLAFSYSDKLSTRDNRRCRLLISSVWYRERWGEVFGLTRDQNEKVNFENTRGGWRLAASIGGAGTGLRADRVICLPFDASIETRYGCLPIGTLVDRRLDVEVLGFDHGTQSLRWCKIRRWEKSPGRPLVKITTASGKEIRATADHPVFVEGVGYVRAGCVLPGQRLHSLRGNRPSEALLAARDPLLLKAVQGPSPIGGCAEAEYGAVRALRGAVLSAASTRHQEQECPHVQQGVRWSNEAWREQSAVHWRRDPGRMLPMRWAFHGHADTGPAPQDMFEALPGVVYLGSVWAAHGDAPLRGVWQAIQAGFARCGALLKGLRASSSRSVHGDGRQPQIRQWGLDWPRCPIPRNWVHWLPERAGQIARWLLLPMVWRGGERRQGAVDPSHRLRQKEQRDGQPDLNVQRLPRQDARSTTAPDGMESDVVRSVERLPDVPDFVYNVATDPCHNYFTAGCLVHNCDDPINVKEGNSAPALIEAQLFTDETLPTRLVEPAESSIVWIMQRVHEQDPVGHILARGNNYTHLMLPMEFEPERCCTTTLRPATPTAPAVTFVDPRTEDGELLFPERYPQETVDELKGVGSENGGAMSSYAWSGQMQQRPSPRGGAMIRVDRLEIVDGYPAEARLMRSWDLAGTKVSQLKKNDPDWTRGALCAFHAGVFYVLDMRSIRSTSGEVKALIKQTAQLDGYKVPVRIPQDAGSGGKSVAEDYVLNVLPGWSVRLDRETGDKVTRADPFVTAVEHHNVRLVAGDWNKDFLAEATTFPFGRHDDQIDAVTGAFVILTQAPPPAPAWSVPLVDAVPIDPRSF